jgi:carboxymethylenebutenolidase
MKRSIFLVSAGFYMVVAIGGQGNFASAHETKIARFDLGAVGVPFDEPLLRAAWSRNPKGGDAGNRKNFRISKKSKKRYRKKSKKRYRSKKYGSSSPPIPHVFRPKGSGPYPGIILLHTSGGVKSHIVKFGRQLVGNGYVAVVVDYLTSGGTDNIDKGYDRLMKDAKVANDRIGVVGFSKGGDQGIKFINYSHNFTERRVQAFVSHYIGPVIPTNDELQPPMLFLHEGVVSKITPAAVENFCKLQVELGMICETHIYKRAHHGWDTNCSYCKYSGKITKDAFKRTIEFLDTHLKELPGPASGKTQ